MRRCLTTSKAHIVLKELHEGVAGRHFVANIIAKKILDVVLEILFVSNSQC